MSAVAMLPETVNLGWSSVAAGFAIGKIQRYRWALWIGWASLTLGSGLLYLLKPDTSPVQWVFLNIPLGIGVGTLFTPQILCIQASTE